MPAVGVDARLAQQLHQTGLRAGLDAVGFCDARPFDQARRLLEERKSAGWSGGMQFTYRNPARSTDPSLTMPGVVALVVGARSYLRREPGPARPALTARVARYSWIDHYQPLRDALGQVAEQLREEGWRARVLADDNALVDRAAAVRAGIGWYGKNTNVLIPGAGSWFVLGSVLTDAPLAEEVADPEPVPDGCGSCRRCLGACPTGAIIGPGQLDARRCLAWLLQASGVFPVEFRAALGNRLYGCDDCQEACPINITATRRHPPASAEATAQPEVDVLALLAATDEEIMAQVGRWYIPGREARYVRRNALVVLGNIGDGTDAPVVAALERALADDDPIVRGHAVWAAARLGRLDLLAGLIAGAGVEDPLVAVELEAALDHL
jgi:epoxyqueuosine reductase